MKVRRIETYEITGLTEREITTITGALVNTRDTAEFAGISEDARVLANVLLDALKAEGK